MTFKGGVAVRRDQVTHPIRRGEPGYQTWLDADQDGVACEWAAKAPPRAGDRGAIASARADAAPR